MSFIGSAVKQIGKALGISPPGQPMFIQQAPLPTAPSTSNNSADLDAAAMVQQRAMLGGRTSTMLNGGAGFEENTKNTSKVLLGQ